MSRDLFMSGISKNKGAYHLNCSANEISDNIIIVGDPDRVNNFRPFFSKIWVEKQHREFRVLGGLIQNKEVTIISSGMGTDNIDILIQELHYIVQQEGHRKLHFLRLGTTGALPASIPVGTIIQSQYAVGLDGMLNYYHHEKDQDILNWIKQFCKAVDWPNTLAMPYFSSASYQFNSNRFVIGLTFTTNGFYGAQNRKLNLETTLNKNFLRALAKVEYQGIKASNFEMEMAGIYGLANLLGHEANGLCLVLANRDQHDTLENIDAEMKKFLEIGVDEFIAYLKHQNHR